MFAIAYNSEIPQAQHFCALLPNSYDFRPKLSPRDYHDKAIQNLIQHKIRFIPVSEPFFL